MGRRGEQVPSNCKHSTWGSSEPFTLLNCQRPSLSAALVAEASALAHRHKSLLIPSKQEAVEEVDGTLAVLLSLLCHQVGRRAQEEAGEQGSYKGRQN